MGKRRRRPLTRLVLGLAFLGILALGASLALPYAGFQGETFVDIPHGAGTRTIAAELARNGVVRGEWQFLLVRAIRRGSNLQAGEYRFHQPASPWEVFSRIARGDIFYYQLSVPEGNNMFDIAQSVASLGTMTAADFLRAARNPAIIRDLDARAPTLEGYLFPSTYHVTRHMTAAQIAKQMTDAFRKNWRSVAGPGVDVHDTVTLASLIEKESAVAVDRPKVASVYLNRLRIGMPLQCDPTTIYAALLDDRYRGTIYRSDLESGHPYNTYRHAGLPPGPIANPGVASLKAALHPDETDFLYFVAKADGSGGHTFSRDFASHETAVSVFRRSARNGNGR